MVIYLPLIYKYECNENVLQKIIVQITLTQYHSNSKIREGCIYEQNFLVRKAPRAGDKLTQKLLLVLQILLINKIFAYWIFTVNLLTFLFFFIFFPPASDTTANQQNKTSIYIWQSCRLVGNVQHILRKSTPLPLFFPYSRVLFSTGKM